MAVLDFLNNGKRDLTCMYFNHGTEHSETTYKFVYDYCQLHGIKFISSKIDCERDRTQSLEEFWRIERYKFLNSVDMDVITCHHLDDSVETWLFNCFHGNPNLIPYRNKNVIRPFLVTTKDEFVKWCVR